MVFTWQWWVCQALMAVALVFVVIQMQQKTAVRLLWYRMVATLIALVAVSFLGIWSVIIVMIAGIIRLCVALFFAYRPTTKIIYKYVAGLFIVALIISLNVIFWENWLSGLSIVFGISMVIMYLQRDAKRMRIVAVPVGLLGVTFYSLQLTPMNAAIELFALLSTIIGIIRLDRKQKEKRA